MSLNQFAMVEELAFLVKDNLPCKHLVLSMEETLVNFLQDENSDVVLELEPMNSYNRLLLHRLADIFGFAHVSVGEGDDRHLILERCLETSIPSILVSDILFQYGEPEAETSPQLLRTKDASLASNLKSPSHTLEERQAAYMLARERIFSLDADEMRETVKRKPRSVPVVAQRMIAHALGKKMSPSNPDCGVRECEKSEVVTNELNTQAKDKLDSSSSLETSQEIISLPCNASVRANSWHDTSTSSLDQKEQDQERSEKNCTQIGKAHTSSCGSDEDYTKKEHLGAAKRMFAHALGLQPMRSGSHLKGSAKTT
ncbi:hypothetical protein K2173_025639 [Erythroxylum novogranatense]|uniref:R3H domain-containing protein n=1 Tax=Erythroxylum novogranatense TaxID=1862640 RepID=A0AAV8SNW7_9ROSI|nr:hypothetical protein K2173_025639 [Erythroxylum novogranatense]